MKIVLASLEPCSLPDSRFGHTIGILVRVEAPRDEIVGALVAEQPDVVILSFDNSDVVAVIQELRIALPKAALVPYSDEVSNQLLLALMRVGIVDILLEDSDEPVEEVIRRAVGRHVVAANPVASRARIVAFIASKGGDGGTFILANFANALATLTGKRVLVMDLAIPFGDVDIYSCGAVIEHDLTDFVAEAHRLDHALLEGLVFEAADGVDLIPSPGVMERIVRLTPENISALVTRLEQFYDYILFDFGSCIDHLRMPLVDRLDTIYLVSKLQLPSTRRAGQLLKFLEDVEFPLDRVSVVINEHGINPLKKSEFEEVVGQAIYRNIPEASADQVRTALSLSVPVARVAPKSRFARSLSAWASEFSGHRLEGMKPWRFFGNR